MMRNICVFVPLLVLVQLLNLGAINVTYYSEKSTWKRAQDFCRKKHSDLVTIRNEEENKQLYRTDYHWIGLYRENKTSPWKWSRGDKEAAYINWNSGEPHYNEHCVSKTAYWYNIVCHSSRPFICYDEELLLVKENKTWEEALHHCRSLGGVNLHDPEAVYRNHLYDLATLITDNDHARAQKQAQQATTDEVWTGLRYLAGQWVWVGGEQVKYQDIKICPTNNLCGVVEKNSNKLFGTRDCKEKRNFFCYRSN